MLCTIYFGRAALCLLFFRICIQFFFISLTVVSLLVLRGSCNAGVFQELIVTPDGLGTVEMFTFVSGRYLEPSVDHAPFLARLLWPVLSHVPGLAFLQLRLRWLLLGQGWVFWGVASIVMDSGSVSLPSIAAVCWMLLLDLPMWSGLLPGGSSFGSRHCSLY